MSLRPFVTKLLNVAAGQIHERLQHHMKDVLLGTPAFEMAWREPEEKAKRWKVSITLSVGRETFYKKNAWILQRLSIKDSPFEEVWGLIGGITYLNRLFLPSSMEFGVMVNKPIPTGLLVLYNNSRDQGFQTLPNRVNPEETPEVNPFTELIRFEHEKHPYRSKLVSAIDHLSKGEKWEGSIGLVGTVSKFEFEFPRTMTAIPWGNKTILTVSSGVRYDGAHRYSSPSEGKTLGAKIVRPDMRDLKHHLEVLNQLNYLVNHVNYNIKTFAEFPRIPLLLPKLLALEIRKRQLSG
ncbi:MAG: hypothetical protein ACFFDP_05350 [Promethearchaeota archaeon]